MKSQQTHGSETSNFWIRAYVSLFFLNATSKNVNNHVFWIFNKKRKKRILELRHLPGTKPRKARLEIYGNLVTELASQEGQRHSVSVAGGRPGRRVNISMSVHPDDTHVAVDTAVTGDRTDRQTVISSEYDALVSTANCLLDDIGNLQHDTIR